MSEWYTSLLGFQTDYNLLLQVFALYEDGKLVKVPKAKLGMTDTKMDCRGSNFKGLWNLNMPTINDVLGKIISKKLDLLLWVAPAKR